MFAENRRNKSYKPNTNAVAIAAYTDGLFVASFHFPPQTFSHIMERVQTHKTYALITALIMIVVGTALYFAKLSHESWASWLVYIPFLGGLILNAQAYSKANQGYITYGQAFSSCFKATAIVTLIMLAWTILSVYIFPDMKEQAFEQAQQQMEAQGQSEEAMEMTLNMTRKYFTLFLVLGVLFAYMFFGAIFSLIAAATAKRKAGGAPPQMDVMQGETGGLR